jgi:hypothetical protein
MITIDEACVDSAAPNPEAIKNGRGLVLKNKFTALHTSEDGTILFGECQGSGKEPYRCSCDFARDSSLQVAGGWVTQSARVWHPLAGAGHWNDESYITKNRSRRVTRSVVPPTQYTAS